LNKDDERGFLSGDDDERGWDAVRIILAILAFAPLVGVFLLWFGAF